MPNLRTHKKLEDNHVYSLWQCRTTGGLYTHRKRVAKDFPLDAETREHFSMCRNSVVTAQWLALNRPEKSIVQWLRIVRAAAWFKPPSAL